MTLLKDMTRLAETIHADYFAAYSPYWEPLKSCKGVLTQIDNMVAGMGQRIAALERENAELRRIYNLHITESLTTAALINSKGKAAGDVLPWWFRRRS